ncbi:MAG: Na/Pi symporter [Desulfobulbaceae bacterium]|nr:Na/Pi symporter [Desulfobulbaceae bacterium]
MLNFQMIFGLLGGLGLFLLGMRLMTDGLRLAAGSALRTIIAKSTCTVMRGLLSGAFITALVHASSALVVASIGFVNAGLMTLTQAIVLIYGSNVGTTMTGWMVALIGLDINIKALALPMLGVGMVMRVAGSGRRYGAVGEALAGFGLFFLGIDELKSAFAGLGESISLGSVAGNGFLEMLLFVGVGFVLTFLMQSSSAALAITLTAASGSVVSLQAAAAMVIGANVGTTTTAALAAIGATANAKRVAAAHVLFNLITGTVAFLLLPPLFSHLDQVVGFLGLDTAPSTLLALYHTMFNVLGVILMLPFNRQMVRMLEGRFRSHEENEAQPRYLDRTVVSTPVMAMHALAMELGRIGAIARRMAAGAISSEKGPGVRLQSDKVVLDSLVDAATEFSTATQRGNLPRELDGVLPTGLRVTGYYTIMAELAIEVAEMQSEIQPVSLPEVAEQIASFKGAAAFLLTRADSEAEGFSTEECERLLAGLVDDYHLLKNVLLLAGTKGTLSSRQMVHHLEQSSNIRRIGEEAEKGARYLAGFTNLADGKAVQSVGGVAETA